MVPGDAMANGTATGEEPDARPVAAADAPSSAPANPQANPPANSPKAAQGADAGAGADRDAGTEANGEAVERLAGEVLRYLQRHPNAADTVEGIAQWWIARQRLVETRAQVRAALDRLVARHLVEAADAANGRPRYRLRRDAPETAAIASGAAPNPDTAPEASRTSSPPASSKSNPITSDRANHAAASQQPSSAAAPISDAPDPDAPGPDAPDAAPMSPTAKPRSGGD